MGETHHAVMIGMVVAVFAIAGLVLSQQGSYVAYQVYPAPVSLGVGQSFGVPLPPVSSKSYILPSLPPSSVNQQPLVNPKSGGISSAPPRCKKGEVFCQLNRLFPTVNGKAVYQKSICLSTPSVSSVWYSDLIIQYEDDKCTKVYIPPKECNPGEVRCQMVIAPVNSLEQLYYQETCTSLSFWSFSGQGMYSDNKCTILKQGKRLY